MLYIEKGREPDSLTKYKKEKFAYYDGFKEKDDIRKHLLEEQGHLCAYCMRRIDMKHMKIEHWYPEDLLSDLECLDYKNMLGACEGHITGTKGCDDTCDTHKGNAVITVNPHDENTIKKVNYRTATGEIYSDDEDIQRDLDEILNLNSEKHSLKGNRKAMLNSAITEMSKLQRNGIWKKKNIEDMIIYYQSSDSDGKKKEYAGIVLWYLQKKLR